VLFRSIGSDRSAHAKGALDAALAVAQQMPTGGLVKQRS